MTWTAKVDVIYSLILTYLHINDKDIWFFTRSLLKSLFLFLSTLNYSKHAKTLSVHAIKHERYVLIFDVAETIVSIHMSKCIKTRFKKGDKYPFVCIIE